MWLIILENKSHAGDPPGGTVSFELRAVEAVGEGLLRWAPLGGHIVAKWDFVVEND